MRVFIQAATGSVEKQCNDEKTLAYRSTETVARPYPFPYGFVLETQGEDGGNVDCYVISRRPLIAGEVVDCEPAALLEQLEDGEVDHKVLAVFPDEGSVVDSAAIETLRAFIIEMFVAFPEAKLELGSVRDAEAARAHLRARAGSAGNDS